MEDILFNKAELRECFEAYARKMVDEIDSLLKNRLLNSSVEDLCGYFVVSYTINVPKLNKASSQADYRDAILNVIVK
jgi:hypothetical protein